MISFDPATLTFTVNVVDKALAPFYDFAVFATCDDLAYTDVQSFRTDFKLLTVWRECDDFTAEDKIYVLND